MNNATIGWIATAAFAASYLCKNPQTLRRVQALAASLWILYGALVGAWPVIVSNAVVATMAVLYPWAKDVWTKSWDTEQLVDQSIEEAINSHLSMEPLSLPNYSSRLRPRPVTLDA